MNKYNLTDNTMKCNGITLYKIEKKESFSKNGDCFIYDNAMVFGNTQIIGNTIIAEDEKLIFYFK